MPDPIPSGLAPCPFCGGSEIFVERVDYSSCYVICNDCSARGPVSCDENDADAEASENDFVDPGELPARRLWNQRAFLIERLTSAPAGDGFVWSKVIDGQMPHLPDGLIYGWRTTSGKVYMGDGYPVPPRSFVIDKAYCDAILTLSTAPSPSPVARVPDELRGKIKDIINQHVGECARLGGNLHMPVLHPGPAADRILALFTAAASDGWHLVETAPHACHVLAARFDGDEWAMAVVSSPPSKPFTHWRLLPKPPSSSSETSGEDVGGGR